MSLQKHPKSGRIVPELDRQVITKYRELIQEYYRIIYEISDKKVRIETKDGQAWIDADDIILAIGYNPNPLSKENKHVHIVGDAYSVGNLRTVVWRAWEVAEKI